MDSIFKLEIDSIFEYCDSFGSTKDYVYHAIATI